MPGMAAAAAGGSRGVGDLRLKCQAWVGMEATGSFSLDLIWPFASWPLHFSSSSLRWSLQFSTQNLTCSVDIASKSIYIGMSRVENDKEIFRSVPKEKEMES